MKQSKNNELAKKEADRLNKDKNNDMSQFEMRPRNPFDILKKYLNKEDKNTK